MDTNDSNSNNNDRRIIDTKLPLTWLLSSAAAIIISMTLIAINFNRQSDALSVKMDALIASNADMKMQLKDRDIKYDAIRESMYGLQRKMDAIELKVDANARGSNRSNGAR